MKFWNCNVMATKIMWLHLSTNILLSPLITLTYYLVPNSSPSQYTKLYWSIVKNGLFYIALLRNPPAVILLSSHLLGISFSIPYYWEMYQPSFYSSFDFYSPISHLLECGLPWFNLVKIWITSYCLTIVSQWRNYPTNQVWLT